MSLKCLMWECLEPMIRDLIYPVSFHVVTHLSFFVIPCGLANLPNISATLNKSMDAKRSPILVFSLGLIA